MTVVKSGHSFATSGLPQELPAHAYSVYKHSCKNSANMGSPMGRAHDGGSRRSLRPVQHGEHASLFRPGPAFARGASFGLRLARLMPRANGRLRCNGSPLARATTLTAGASTSVRSGDGLTPVSVGAPTATSLTPIAPTPCLMMRSAMVQLQRRVARPAASHWRAPLQAAQRA